MATADPTTETRWTLIARAASTEEPDAEALNELLTLYTPVLQNFVRRWPNLDESTGEDLVQGFIHQRILEKQLLQKADMAKGRFRTFLFRSFRNFITDEFRKQQAARRTPGQGNLVSFDELEGAVGQESELERSFHVAWVRQLVEEASHRMRAHCEQKGRMDCWLVFELRLMRPLLEGVEPISYDELVETLKLKSPSQASNVLITSKRMMKTHLEEVIRETVNHPEDVAEEWAFLKEFIAPKN